MGATAIRSAVGVSRAATGRRHHVLAGQGRERTRPTFAGLDEPTGVTPRRTSTRRWRTATRWPTWPPGDIRPDEAINDIERCLRAGAHVVTPSLYSLYDPRSAPPEWVERLTQAAEEGGATLLVSGVDPGWGNDALAVIAAGSVHPDPVHPLPGDLRLLDL